MMLRFRTKYHPDEYVSRQDEARQILKHRCRVFMKLLELGWLSDVAVDNDHTNELIRVLDAGAIQHSYTMVAFPSFLISVQEISAVPGRVFKTFPTAH